MVRAHHLYVNILMFALLCPHSALDGRSAIFLQNDDAASPKSRSLDSRDGPPNDESNSNLAGEPEFIEGVLVEIQPDQANSWQVHNYFEDFDFREKYLMCIDSDPHGNVWIAASDGLYFFDGFEWQKFGIETGLPTSVVRSVKVSRDGTVWVGTAEGVGRFRNGRFELFKESLAGPSVRRIVEDRQGGIWFCCDQWPRADLTGGLSRYFKGKVTSWTTADGLPSNYVSDFFEDSKGRRFVLTNVGLAQFDGESFSQPLVESGVWLANTYVWSMVESKKHGLLVSTTSNYYQFKDNVWQRIPAVLRNHAGPKLIVTQDDEIYSMNNGHRSQLLRFDGENWETLNQSILGTRGGTQMLHQDASGAIWIVGFQRIMRWDRSEPQWHSFRSIGPPVAKDQLRGIWFHSPDKGLLRLDGDKWYRFDVTAQSVHEDVQGTVWIQTKKRLYRHSSGNRINSVNSKPSSDPLRFLGVDQEGTLWMHGRSSKTSITVHGYGNSRHHETNLDCDPTDSISRICYDPEGGLWVVVANRDSIIRRLIHIDLNQQTVLDLPERAQLTSVPKLLVRSKNHLLLGGFFGLYESKNAGKSWKYLKTPAESVSRLFEMDGNVWVVFRGHLGGVASTGKLVDGNIQSIASFNGDFVRTAKDSPHIFFDDFGRIHRLDSDLPRILRPPILTPLVPKIKSVYCQNRRTYWVGTSSSAFKYTEPNSPIRVLVGNYPKSIQEFDDIFLPIDVRRRYRPGSEEGSFFVSSRVGDNTWSDFRPFEDSVKLEGVKAGTHEIQLRIMESSGRITELPEPISLKVLPVPIQLRPWFRPVVTGVLAAILLSTVIAIANWRRARSLANDLQREVANKTGSLYESEGKYKLLFQESQDAILLTNSDAKIFRSNEAARDLLGFRGVDHQLTDFIQSPEKSAEIRKILSTGTALEDCRIELRGKDGREITALVSIKRMESLGENEPNFQVIIRDTSDLMRLEKRIAESEKLQALGRLAGGIAHDFNNFLAIILFGADLIEVQADNDPLIEQGLQSILGGVERGKALVSQIQSYNRAASQHPGSIEPGQLLRKFPVIANKILPANINLLIEDFSAGTKISVEENQLEQVLINLAVNASHAMPDGGDIRIRSVQLSGVEVPKLLELDASQSYVLLEIEDNGCGMDSDLKAKIFDPFFTTKSAGHGTGLGLAIVYGIVKQCGGAIEVKSTPEVGTLFQIYFPESDETAIEPQTESGSHGNTHSGRILVVDDEPQLRRLIKMSLENYGYNVSIAESGEEALEFLQAGDDYDLLISDILMAGMTGLELVERLEKERPNLPTLLVSGYPQSDKDESFERVSTPILMKPFRPVELVDKAEKVIASYTQARQAS